MTDYSNLQKFKNAALHKYCGEDNCTDTASLHNCVWATADREKNLKPCPEGYKFDAWDDGSMCAPNYWGRRCIKDPTSEFWEGAYAKSAKLSNPTKTAMANAFKCCSNGFPATSDNVEKCGSLYTGVDKAFNPECNRLFKAYCVKGENVNTELCKNKIVDYPELRTKLFNICPTKIGQPDWEDVCSCYYGYDYNEQMAKAIESRWVGPENGITRFPECINPRCRASPYRNKENDDKCGSVSFTQCVNEMTLDASNSTLGNIELKQNNECINTFKRKDSTSDNSSSEGAPPAPSGGAPKAAVNTIIITIICVIIAAVTGGYLLLSNKKSIDSTSEHGNNSEEDKSIILHPITSM